MDNPHCVFSSPTRICLSGEDLDWMGYRCICLAIDLPTQARLIEGGETHDSIFYRETWSFVQRMLGYKDKAPPAIAISNSGPIASGISSSTALTMALLKTFLYFLNYPLPSRYNLAKWTYAIENKISRCGGMDQLTIAFGGLLLMKGKTQDLPIIIHRTLWPSDISILLIDSRQPKCTKSHIELIRERILSKDKALFKYIRLVDALSKHIWDAIITFNLRKLAQGINVCHRAMNLYQKMSTEYLELLRHLALENGCLAAKLTGAGGGGCLFALVTKDKSQEVCDRLLSVFTQKGLPVQVIEVLPYSSEVLDVSVN